MNSIKNIVIVGFIVIVFINCMINKKVRDFIKNFFNMKIFKSNITIGIVILAGILVFSCLKIFNYITITIDNIKIYRTPTDALDETLESGYRNSDEERIIYKEMMKMESNINNCQNPYIPSDFKYIEGEWNTGFVIEDKNANQYVWIPCTNIENSIGINILKRSDFTANAFVKAFLCYEDNENYIDFLRSAIQNGGFYISRFEIGKDENGNPVSKMGYEVWTNITKEEAKEKADLMEDNINCELINGYAYDTAFNFIYDDINKSEYFNSTGISGTESLKNIYDMTDDMYELTTEMQFDATIYRGIMPDNEYINTVSIDNRFVTTEDYFADNLGFRTILYR